MQKTIIVPIDTLLNYNVNIPSNIKMGDSLILKFLIFEKGLPKDISNQAASIVLKKSDGTSIEQTTTGASNIVTIELDKQSTSSKGKVFGEIALSDETGVTITNDFVYTVKNAFSNDIIIKSEDRIETLEDMRAIIRDFEDEISAIGTSAEAISALNSIKDYIDSNLPDLINQNSLAKSNISKLETENSRAETNTENLKSENETAEDKLDKFRLYDTTNLIQQVQDNTTQLNANTNNIGALKRNRIFNSPIFGNPNCYTSDRSYILNDLKKLKKIGVDSIIITARTGLTSDNVNIELTQSLDVLVYIYDTAKDLGLNTFAIRVSASSYNNKGYDFITNWNTWNVQYKEIVTNIINTFKDKDIKYFIPFNETEKIMCDLDDAYTSNPYTNTGTEQETYVNEILNLCKDNNFVTGVNVASMRYCNFLTNDILNNCDVLFFNNYLQIGTNGESLSLKDRINIVNDYVDTQLTPVMEKFKKDIFIGECGIMSYWEAMMSPASYDFSDYDEVENGKPVEYYWEGIFNSSLQSKVKGIGIWFHEHIKDDNIEFFNRYIGRWE